MEFRPIFAKWHTFTKHRKVWITNPSTGSLTFNWNCTHKISRHGVYAGFESLIWIQGNKVRNDFLNAISCCCFTFLFSRHWAPSPPLPSCPLRSPRSYQVGMARFEQVKTKEADCFGRKRRARGKHLPSDLELAQWFRSRKLDKNEVGKNPSGAERAVETEGALRYLP